MQHTSPSFDTAFPALASLSHRVAFRILGSRSEAEDVAQEALARAYARWRRVGAHAEPWVARVSANLAIDVWRRRRRDFSRPGTDAPPDAHELTVERHRLVEALEALPKRQREVIVLRYLADLPVAAVAAQVGCSVGTVKQHSHRGLARLRTYLGEEVGLV